MFVYMLVCVYVHFYSCIYVKPYVPFFVCIFARMSFCKSFFLFVYVSMYVF